MKEPRGEREREAGCWREKIQLRKLRATGENPGLSRAQGVLCDMRGSVKATLCILPPAESRATPQPGDASAWCLWRVNGVSPRFCPLKAGQWVDTITLEGTKVRRPLLLTCFRLTRFWTQGHGAKAEIRADVGARDWPARTSITQSEARLGSAYYVPGSVPAAFQALSPLILTN